MSEQYVEPKKYILIDRAMWDSIIRRSGETIFHLPSKIDPEYQNYLYEGSRAMAEKFEKGTEAATKIEKEGNVLFATFKFDDELNETFNESVSSRLLTRFAGNSVTRSSEEIAASETVISGNKSLARRKPDAYKTELRQYIESRRQEQIVLNRAKYDSQRLERETIDNDLKQQLNEEQSLLAKRKADKRKIEMELMQISGKTIQ